MKNLIKTIKKEKKSKTRNLYYPKGNKFQKLSVINAKTLAIDESRSGIEFFLISMKKKDNISTYYNQI